MSVTKKDEENWKQGIKDWLEACEKKGYRLGKSNTKSAQEMQREACKGMTIMELIEGKRKK